MKKEIILVPKDKCPLDILAEMGEHTKKSWIFLHFNTIEKLQYSNSVYCKKNKKQKTLILKWKATKTYPETKIVIDISGLDEMWKPIISISASDIAFNLRPVDPENIFFLKMAK